MNFLSQAIFSSDIFRRQYFRVRATILLNAWKLKEFDVLLYI